MGSAELLALLDELPEHSKFKEASERTFWLAEYDDNGDTKLIKLLAAGRPPKDVTVIATYVDWTFDRKLLARNTRELASMRADRGGAAPDLTALMEPLDAVLEHRRRTKQRELRAQAQNHIHAGLYGYERAVT